MDFIDNIYVINLEKRQDRWKECLIEIEKNKLPLDKITKFKAIEYNDDIKNNIFIPHRNKMINNINYCKSAFGCKQSHLLILKKHKDDKDKNILILEDDFNLCDDFMNKYNNIIKDLKDIKDYKMCFLGYSFNKFKSKFKKISNNIGLIKNTYGSQGYIVNSNFINELLDYCNNCKFEIDVCYSHIQNKYNIYSSNEILIKQRPSFSDILKKSTDYSFLYIK
jgi:glycosyl transferase, family 25